MRELAFPLESNFSRRRYGEVITGSWSRSNVLAKGGLRTTRQRRPQHPSHPVR